MLKQKITQLDGLRAFAFGAVFIEHAFDTSLFWAGVDVFFVLSGFLITGVLVGTRNQGLNSFFARFYGKRVRRIVPAYLLYLAVVCFLGGATWLAHWYLYLLPLMNFAPETPGIVVTWSLAVEEQFYLAWPFVVFYFRKQLGWLSLLLVLVAPLLRLAATNSFRTAFGVFSLTPCRMDLLASGALLYLLYNRRRQLVERWGHLAGLASVIAGTLIILALHHFHIARKQNTEIGNVFIYEATLLWAVGIMLWALSGRYVGVLNLRVVRAIGQISYSCYLIHYSLLLFVGRHIPERSIAVPVALALTLAYATLSWRLLEKPILHGGLRVSATAQLPVVLTERNR